ncbi:CxxC-x17-CxxC domain-containing protein [Nanoarchaeota archaeon]
MGDFNQYLGKKRGSRSDDRRSGGSRFGDRRSGGSRSDDRRSGGSRFGDRRTGGNRFDRKRSSFGGRDRPSDNVEMHSGVCSKCGEDCEVPFKPTQGKPLFCSDCFRDRSNEAGSRSEFGKPRSTENIDQINKKLDRILSILEKHVKVEEDVQEEEPVEEEKPKKIAKKPVKEKKKARKKKS